VIEQTEALAKILAFVHPLPAREISLAAATGCFAAEDRQAELSLPLFDNSAMDGYAVVASSCALGTRLRLCGEQPAGIARKLKVAPGEAIRIFTGAPLPAGADAVIMQEDVTVEGNEIIVNAEVENGEFLRRQGGDITAGQKILSVGERITPQMLPLLGAQGIATLRVGGKVRAAIISTGDELILPGMPLQAGQLYESNSTLLHGLLEKCGAEVVMVTHCPDRAAEIEAAVRAGSACDVMIITGGVSVGARDLVKPALAAIGASLDLWRVAVKPGKPFLFGRADGCAIFGLPGNPVSAFVTFLLFVRPALLRMMGANESELNLPTTKAELAVEMRNDSERPHYNRGLLRNGIFTPMGRQESHALFGLSRSNALLLVQPSEQLLAGNGVSVLTWD